jgi:predicted kinase
VLAAVGGLSGTGKSTVSRGVAPGLGASPGAVVLRTDEIRKRLLNVAPTQPVDRALYTPEFYVRTYDALFDDARALLKAGRAVVLDATFLNPALRARAERLAAECGVPFEALWLDAPAQVLEARVAARKGDASDATVEVLHEQMAQLALTKVAWSRLDTAGDVAAAAQAWLSQRGLR